MSGYTKVPVFIDEQIDKLTSNTFYIARSRSFALNEIASGRLGHLGVVTSDGSLNAPSGIVPPQNRGRWSSYNINGRVHVRRDLPKVEKEIGGWQVPLFGDWSKGSRTFQTTREVFQRELWYAGNFPIVISIGEVQGDRVTMGFRVDQVYQG